MVVTNEHRKRILPYCSVGIPKTPKLFIEIIRKNVEELLNKVPSIKIFHFIFLRLKFLLLNWTIGQTNGFFLHMVDKVLHNI